MAHKRTETAPPGPERPETAAAPQPDALRTPTYADRFLSEAEVLGKVPVSRRTWSTWKAKGIVPFIRIGRRCLYSWPQTEAALLRRQRGGNQ